MPIRTKNGKWKWGNVERDSKKELVQTVYGIWKKNGSKGSFSKFLKGTHESYERPYTLDQIKQKYGQETYDKLRNDPVHKWRAETGIELIHKEPTRDEFERIVKNWKLMSDEDKKKSDEKSKELFGNSNERRINLLRKEYDFEVGDKVKIRSGIRCRQSGHTGTIVRIDPPGTRDYDMHGWTAFVVKMNDPKLGIVSFQSGSIDKLDTVKEYWAKNGRYFYCHDCDKNMTKAPDDQYIMIDDDLWEYVCKHGGKKIGTEEDLCRDCIEKRLGRPITLKDLGDKINLPINDEIKKLLKKQKKMNESTDRFQELLDNPTKFDGTKDSQVFLDQMYYCKEYRFAWKIVWDNFRKKSSIHVFKPSIINVAGSKRFGWREYLVDDDHQHMREIDFKDFTSKERAQQEFKKLLEG